jgi:acetyltransferase-like isoleucine patch superfamily enzyme
MINQEMLDRILLKIYKSNNLKIEKQGSKLTVKPEDSAKNYSIPSLSDILTFELYGLNNPTQYLAKKGNWIGRNYLSWNPLPPVKAGIYANKGVRINNIDEVIISPNSQIDCPNDFVNQTLNPLRQVSIGNGTFMGELSKIITTEYDSANDCLTVGHVHLGKKSLAAGAATLHPGTILGNGAIIGASEEVQGIFKKGSVVSHIDYGSNKLPYSLGVYHDRLAKVLYDSTERLKKGTYKGKNLVISKSGSSNNISILPKENAKNVVAEYSRKNLYETVIKYNILSGAFLNMDLNWKKAFEANNMIGMFNTRICMGLAKLILTPCLVRNALYAFGGIHVGNNTKIGRKTMMGYLNSELIYIGNNVSIGSNVGIADHYYTAEGLKKGIIYISDECKIEDNCDFVPPVFLGKGFIAKKNKVFQGVYTK